MLVTQDLPVGHAKCMSQFKMANSGKPAKTEAEDLSKRLFANFASINFLVGAIESLWRVQLVLKPFTVGWTLLFIIRIHYIKYITLLIYRITSNVTDRRKIIIFATVRNN